jgi:hypothetical protein
MSKTKNNLPATPEKPAKITHTGKAGKGNVGKTGKPAHRPKRPEEITALEKKEFATKLEPHLKAGISLYKACALAGINRTAVQRYMADDPSFVSIIDGFRGYKASIYGSIVMAKLLELGREVQDAVSKKQSLRTLLSKNDYKFLEFLAKYDKSLRAEWGSHIEELIDEAGGGKMMFEPPKTEKQAELQTKVLTKLYDYIQSGKAVLADEDRTA